MSQGLEDLKSLRGTRQSVALGMHAFHWNAMEQAFPKKVMDHLKAVWEGKEKFNLEYGDLIAEGLKEWAILHGATHFTHWFQPFRGQAAEKHDSFLFVSPKDSPIERLSARDLFRGESDASSLPSGGLRGCNFARGYTVWDVKAPAFLWKEKGGVTLYLPSLYFSYTSEVLDYKTPLLRSEEKLQKTVLSLLKLFKQEETSVFSTLGCEQEYFLIDRSFYEQRQDLLLAGRTVFGAPPAKGQELQDHYFAKISERVMSFITEFEERAILLGIPVKTRHSEVAPCQFEIAPIFEKTPLAADHNILLMEVMRWAAEKHGFVTLFHEKPFRGFNGSGKHCNWSIGTQEGLNLFDPRGDSLLFLTLLTALIRGAFEHSRLISASLGSSGNDERLGGHEAPPSILSIDLGTTLEEVLEKIQHQKEEKTLAEKIDLVSHLSPFEIDSTDRNRTSFLAFTGQKFELRAVGASQNPSLPITALNAAFSDALTLIIDEMKDVLQDDSLEKEALLEKVLPILKKHLKYAASILFHGNNYSSEWVQEAAKRGLSSFATSFHAFQALLDKKSMRAMEGILSEKELEGLYNTLVEQYAKEKEIEMRLMIEIFQTEILPAALVDQKKRADSLDALVPFRESTSQKARLLLLSETIDEATSKIGEIDKLLGQVVDFGWEGKAKVFSEIGSVKMQEAREKVDFLETLVEDRIWPLAKYRKILY